ncbi:MAG: ABC transporter ATP-binding protein [Vicinamibacteria bacterium]|nr:ABC transporter ATP-binding protein [Vicinamibacteria bacterium]
MSDDMVRIEDARRRYGEIRAVERVSFAIARGEMFGLIGPDGAGKTTTIRLVLGLLKPDAGRVTACGLDPLADHRALTHRVGYLSQRFSLYGDLTVDENIAFFAEIHGVTGWRKRRNELLDMVRMTPFRDRLAERLSGGMKQKLSLVCTLVHTPELLVLDEPTTGVDPVSRRDFWRLLTRLQRDDLTVLVSTPYLDEAERCTRVALMDKGRLLAVDTPDTLRSAWRGTVIEILARPHRIAAGILRGLPDVGDVEVFGERLHAWMPAVDPEEGGAAARRLARQLRDKEVDVDLARPTLPSLEDVFIQKINAAAQDNAFSEVSS